MALKMPVLQKPEDFRKQFQIVHREIDNDAYCVCTHDFSLKLSQNDNFSTSFVWLLCQQWKSSYNINVAFAGSILTYHAIYIVCIFTCSPFSSSARQVVYQRFIHEV